MKKPAILSEGGLAFYLVARGVQRNPLYPYIKCPSTPFALPVDLGAHNTTPLCFTIGTSAPSASSAMSSISPRVRR